MEPPTNSKPMNLNFTEASSLAAIDRQIDSKNSDISPAQYEIIRQVIYSTADFEYSDLLKFSEDALSKGAASLTASTPIVVDVPEIQVGIVPLLQQTFLNPVYCCATSKDQTQLAGSKATQGLETLAQKHPKSIFIIGQDELAFNKLKELIAKKTINPSLAIATPPMFVEPNQRKFAVSSTIPNIYADAQKGGATIATAIFKTLVNLTWQAHRISYSQD